LKEKRMADIIREAGALPDGRAVRAVRLESARLTATLWDHGARLQDLRVAGDDLPRVLGAPDPAQYGGALKFFGPIVGPVANRIRGARFEIDGTSHEVEANQDGRHALHSGAAGLHDRIWEIEDASATAATFAISLPDGEGGYPGARRVRVRWSVAGPVLRLEMEATSDRATPLSLAHHPFWTVQEPRGWAGQRLEIAADRYLPVDGETIPTGKVVPVAGTPFDFRRPRVLDPGTLPPLDHNFCLSRRPVPLRRVCRLDSPGTGRSLEIATTAPGLQVFDMRALRVEETPTLHGGPYPAMAALAIEPQMWPDALGRRHWPDIVLAPGKRFAQVTQYRFDG
jgi:aldose 1-epimerase